jgi:adenylate cyclase
MRQLAAIMFSDMFGYTALMQQNEQLARLKRQKMKDTLEHYVSVYHGRILQNYGDGALSIFNSAIDAVKCGVQIQEILRQEPSIDMRIGIHTGDIAIEEESIYGDGVNLASRIESLAVPGSIFISEKVFDEIKNQENLSAIELGYFELKNVTKPVRIFAVDDKHLVVPNRNLLKGKTRQPTNRLAVLPFINMSADPENEYFSDGITEELLNAITKVDGLQVTSRTSSFAFKGKNSDIRDIGIQLNVDRILEGSVRRSGNRVRITAQLVNTSDGYHIWSENYDRNLTDIFDVQDEISSIIANKLRENLTAREQEERLVKPPTDNLDAYTLYLKGLHFHNKINPADTWKAIAFYEEAIALEPHYSAAYARAAGAYAFLGGTGQMQPNEAFAIVHRYSDKAIQLDSSLDLGHTAKAAAYLFYDWKWDQSYNSLLKAVELNPAATGARQLLCFYYMMMGLPKEAVNIMEKALKIDPLSTVVNQYLAEAYVNAGRIDDALNQVERLLEIHPQMTIALELKGWCLGAKGDWKLAAEIFEKLHLLLKNPSKGLAPLAFAFAKMGETGKALEFINRIEQRQVKEPGVVLDLDLAMIWWSLGDTDKTFHHLFQCIEKRMGAVAIIMHHPMFTGIADDARYQLMKEKLNLAEIR